LVEEAEGDVAMKRENLDVVRGSGNVFRDLAARGKSEVFLNGDLRKMRKSRSD